MAKPAVGSMNIQTAQSPGRCLKVLRTIPKMIRLEKFNKDFYADLICWVDSEEALMQFAGPAFTFPLTNEQLDISLSEKNRHAFRVIENQTNLSIGHCEIFLTDTSAHLGRILIGDKEQRGKGIGKQIVNLLLDLAFHNLNRTKAELNVFDFNIIAIKCYEKVGFVINHNKQFERKINDKTWTALNMTINKQDWQLFPAI